ncbi:hypothetical protein QM012_007228 [Aureobasidium pullulans]|uniref:RING-type domain-containing protein n=1 Tax=Aureobasidium pullulans TaxID=5580 RepID=A0ABR0TNU0_AURPU
MESSVDQNTAAEPRRSGRERNTTQRHASTSHSAGRVAKNSMKRNRANVINDDNDIEAVNHPPKTHARKKNPKVPRKRVATKKTAQSNDVSIKLTAKPPLNSSSKNARDVVDLTGDDHAATSSKKLKTLKAGKGAEKRLKRERSHAPQKYTTVAYRATTQRMVVIDRRRLDNDDCPHQTPHCPMEEIDLAGSTGNIYTVRITHVPECTCPDFRVNNNPQCKHIIYVLLKVLKVSEPLNYQAAFLTSELEEIFAHAGPLPAETVDTEDKDGKRKPIEGDCPICCEELSQEKEAVVWCQAACGNNLHKSCFDQWAATKGHGQVTCPYCRTQWQNEIDGSALKGLAKTGSKNRDGYVNVADQVGMSSRRDYSTYHDYWVRRQQRNGLLDDDDYDYDYGDE